MGTCMTDSTDLDGVMCMWLCKDPSASSTTTTTTPTHTPPPTTTTTGAPLERCMNSIMPSKCRPRSEVGRSEMTTWHTSRPSCPTSSSSKRGRSRASEGQQAQPWCTDVTSEVVQGRPVVRAVSRAVTWGSGRRSQTESTCVIWGGGHRQDAAAQDQVRLWSHMRNMTSPGIAEEQPI